MSLAPGTRLGPYEVTAQIGVGGMGEVYRATDTNLKRAVALKVLPAAVASDPERLARFQREAEVLASLNHPNIAAIFGLERGAGQPALVMELVDGPTLADRIADGPVPVDEAVAIATQIAEALEAAHEQGIVHRDLKPANVKVRTDGTVKVLDFGLAKALATEGAGAASPTGLSQLPTITTPAMTQVGMILGTAAYMSPEQAKGRPVDKRADIWAFGAVLFEMLTGRRVFGGDEIVETLAVVITRDPDWAALPAETPPGVQRMLRRCLEKDPRVRLRDIGDARLDLSGVHEPGPARAPSVPTSISALGGGVPLTVALGMTALVLALLPVTVRHLGETDAPRTPVRLSIDLPAEVRVGQLQHVPVISPDGRHVVFAGQTERGRSLWLRSLDSQDARELPQTTGVGSFPFWSPDSQRVAFVEGQRLWSLRLVDGVREPLADLSGPDRAFRGGAWGEAGDIVFAHGQGLFHAAPGRPAAPVFQPFLGEGDVPRAPAFLPGGRRLVYGLGSGSRDRAGIWVGSLDGGQPTRILETGQTLEPGAVFAGGHLLYVLDGFPVARAFDLERLTFTGAPVVLGPQGAAGRVSASATGRLAYRAQPFAVSQLTWLDRAGRAVGTVGTPDVQNTFDLSPDGRRVIAARGTTPRNLWVLDADRDTASRVTLGPYQDVDPRWSPDASRILFASTRAPGRAPHEVSVGGGNPALLIPWAGVNFGLDDWSSDGRFILYHDANVSPELWAMALEGDRRPVSVVKALTGVIDQGQFSPDGRLVAYGSEESGTDQVYVAPFPATGDRWQISATGGVQPMWRSDGRELFFLTLDGALMSVTIDRTGPFKASTPRLLFRTALRASAQTEEYAVAPSGERFLMALPVEAPRSPFHLIIDWPSLLASPAR